MAKKEIENERLVAILDYFLIGIIWYFVDENIKKSSLANFHTKQALNLLIISIAAKIIFWILSSILAFTIILIPIIIVIGAVLSLFIFILWILGIIYAINGEKKEIPIIGKFAKRYLRF